MRVLLFVSLLLIVKGCPSICTFLYNNQNWAEYSSIGDTSFNEEVDHGSVTGIVTAKYNMISPSCDYKEGYWQVYDNLRFIRNEGDEEDQALFIQIHGSGPKLTIRGRKGGTRYGELTLTASQLGNEMINDIQISDNYSSLYYKMFYGVPGNSSKLEYNYRNEENWTRFNEVRIRDTVKLKNDGRCTVFEYITACRDSTPILCDTETNIVKTGQLGESYNLTCSGSGAPYLGVTWEKDHTTCEASKSKEIYNNLAADHQINSILKIESFSLNDIGTWTCTIFNKNFRDSVTKTYTLRYSSQVQLLSSPDSDYYTNKPDGNTTFEWVVQGWPLDQISFDCGAKNADNVSKDDPPQVKFTLSLQDDDQVLCTLMDGSEVLDTKNITRVGYHCEAGDQGIGKDCVMCPEGQTSVTGSAECFPVTSTCGVGFWGVDDRCTPCPMDQTSKPNAVKPQECFSEKKNPLLYIIGSGVGAAVLIAIMAIILISRRRCRSKEMKNTMDLTMVPAQTASEPTSYSMRHAESHPTQEITSTDPHADLEDPDYSYAVINKPSRSTVNKNKIVPSALKGGLLKESNKNTSQTPPPPIESSKKENGDNDGCYATLGDTMPTSSVVVEDEGAYACLNRPGSTKKATEGRKKEDDDLEKDDDLYCNLNDACKETTCLKDDDALYSQIENRCSADAPHNEDATYACVELVQTAKLRQTRPEANTADTARRVETEYSSIRQLK